MSTSRHLRPTTCPRCGGGFDCGAQAGHCDCFDISLTPALRQAIAQRWADCLCVPCLRQLTREPGMMADPCPDPAPTSTASPPSPSS